ncbi:unnamed protein product, partial [Ixodes hexagonus]
SGGNAHKPFEAGLVAGTNVFWSSCNNFCSRGLSPSKTSKQEHKLIYCVIYTDLLTSPIETIQITRNKLQNKID